MLAGAWQVPTSSQTARVAWLKRKESIDVYNKESTYSPSTLAD